MVELAKNQPGGLLSGDGMITTGTIPDHHGFFFVRLRLEQMCLSYSIVMSLLVHVCFRACLAARELCL